MDLFFFYAFAGLILGGALLTITLRNPVHCAVSLLVSLTGVAGLFLQARAEFLFVAQLIVYVGGVVLLFLFVIMLVNLDQVAGERKVVRWWVGGAGVAAALAAEMLFLLRWGADVVPAAGSGEMPADNTLAVGAMMMSEYLLPFEIVSVLLLAAMVGAVLIARRPVERDA